MGDYKRLQVWHRARTLVTRVYQLTNALPAEERFGLVSQMRRAAVSVAANIAEGSGRGSDAELSRFLRLARGSLHELECEIQLAVDLGLVRASDVATLQAQVDELSRMLVGLGARRTRADRLSHDSRLTTHDSG